jgi:hypothetical protein
MKGLKLNGFRRIWRFQRFFRVSGDSFHKSGLARGMWRRNDALATIA